MGVQVQGRADLEASRGWARPSCKEELCAAVPCLVRCPAWLSAAHPLNHHQRPDSFCQSNPHWCPAFQADGYRQQPAPSKP